MVDYKGYCIVIDLETYDLLMVEYSAGVILLPHLFCIIEPILILIVVINMLLVSSVG